MSSHNSVLIVGNLGRDPEVRALSSGDKVANLSVATSETWKDKTTGERQERTEWHRVTVFGYAADFAEKYLKKGAKVLVQGSLRTRKWQDQSGADRYTTEIVVNNFDGKLTSLSRGEASEGSDESGSGDNSANDTTNVELDDDIPF